MPKRWRGRGRFIVLDGPGVGATTSPPPPPPPPPSAPSWLTDLDPDALSGLSFVDGAYYDPSTGEVADPTTGLTYARAGTVYDVGDSLGALTSYGANVPPANDTYLLLEPARTNICRRTLSTTSPWLVVSCTAVQNASDPAGGSTGVTVTASSTGTERRARCQTGNTANATAYTLSFFVEGSGFVQLSGEPSGGIPWGSNVYANYALSGDGSVTATGADVTAAGIEKVGSRWRVWLTATTNGVSSGGGPNVVLIDAGNDAHLGSVAGGTAVIVSAWQMETGAGPTSPIVTTTSDASRAAPTAASIDISDWTGDEIVIQRAGAADVVAARSALDDPDILDLLDATALGADLLAGAGTRITAIYARAA